MQQYGKKLKITYEGGSDGIVNYFNYQINSLPYTNEPTARDPDNCYLVTCQIEIDSGYFSNQKFLSVKSIEFLDDQIVINNIDNKLKFKGNFAGNRSNVYVFSGNYSLDKE
jgi:hypothetical protein